MQNKLLTSLFSILGVLAASNADAACTLLGTATPSNAAPTAVPDNNNGTTGPNHRAAISRYQIKNFFANAGENCYKNYGLTLSTPYLTALLDPSTNRPACETGGANTPCGNWYMQPQPAGMKACPGQATSWLNDIAQFIRWDAVDENQYKLWTAYSNLEIYEETTAGSCTGNKVLLLSQDPNATPTYPRYYAAPAGTRLKIELGCQVGYRFNGANDRCKMVNMNYGNMYHCSTGVADGTALCVAATGPECAGGHYANSSGTCTRCPCGANSTDVSSMSDGRIMCRINATDEEYYVSTKTQPFSNMGYVGTNRSSCYILNGTDTKGAYKFSGASPWTTSEGYARYHAWQGGSCVTCNYANAT